IPPLEVQRFAGLNSIEGWNLTFQLSASNFFEKNSKLVLTFSNIRYIIFFVVSDTTEQTTKCAISSAG
ncbi:hypothetical protein, partial [Mediterraneibacter faecis]|uniref:hypothetical protein n=1 Tax=Mediterraneibacter faecis TaxID=592978 RepID=UPI0032C1BE5D